MIAIGLIVLAAAVPDAPRRTDVDMISAQSVIDLQACMTRRLLTRGIVTPIPIENGVALDVSSENRQAILSFEIKDLEGVRHLTVAYRHPVSAKRAVAYLNDLSKRCFPEAAESQAR